MRPDLANIPDGRGASSSNYRQSGTNIAVASHRPENAVNMEATSATIGRYTSGLILTPWLLENQRRSSTGAGPLFYGGALQLNKMTSNAFKRPSSFESHFCAGLRT